MNEIDDNQQNSRRQQHGQPTQDEEHETHTAALVLLVLAVIVVIAVIFAVNRDVSNLNPANYGDEVSEPINNETHGAGIPVEFAQASEISDTFGLPDDIPIPENAEVMQNYESSVGDGGTQRVYMFTTSNPATNLSSSYKNYFNDTDLTIDNIDRSSNSISLQASNSQEQQLIIAVSSMGSSSEVQINYINQSN